MSSRLDHWLSAVANVLRAPTGSLRELALAAGRDPATFYEGADLTGADLRGQDLRGMKLSVIDPRLVLIDDKTIIDDDLLINKFDLFGASPLILLAVESNLMAKMEDIINLYNCYSDRDADNFFIDAGKFDGPKLIITDSPSSWPNRSGIIKIVPMSEGRFGLRDFDPLFRQITGPAILVPVPLKGAGANAAPILDLIELIDVNWFQSPLFSTEDKTFVFLKARGVGADPWVDAFFRLYSQASKLHLPMRGFYMGPLHNSSQYDLKLMFMPDVVALDMNVSRRMRRYRAAALFEFGRSDDIPALGGALMTLMSSAGWEVEDRVDGEFKISSFNNNYLIKMGSAPPRAEINIGIERTKILNVVDDPSDYIISSRFKDGSIVVSVADLLLFHPSFPSIWSLVRYQAERFTLTRDTNSKALYFGKLISLALDRSNNINKSLRYSIDSNINDLINGRRLRNISNFSAKLVDKSDISSVFLVSFDIFDLNISSFSHLTKMQLKLTIGAHGPSIEADMF